MREIRIAALFVLVCFAAAGGELAKLSMDDASGVGLKIEADSTTKVEGKGSVKITTSWPTTVCLGEVTPLDAGNTKLVYRARVKSRLEGKAYLELWVRVSGRMYFSRGLDHAVEGNADWKELQTPFFLKPGQKADKAVLNLVINGTGSVWVDDLVLSTPSEAPQKPAPRTGKKGISFQGGDGSSMAKAVVIKGAQNSFTGVAAESRWIRQNHPDWRKMKQALLSEGGKHFDRIEYRTPGGETRTVYFDITDFFGKW